MKIFIDGHFLDGKKHGVSLFLYNLYMRMIKNNPNFTFIFGVNSSSSDLSIFRDYTNVVLFEYKYKGWFRYFVEMLRLRRCYDVDIIHFQYVLPFFCGDVKKIVTIHDVLFEDFKELFSFKYRLIRHWVFKYSAIKADLITTVSQYSKNQIIKHYSISSSKIDVVPNGVDIKQDVFESNYFCSKPYILYISRFEYRKNHMRLLAAYYSSELYEVYDLVLCGFDVDNSLSDILKFIDEHNIKNKVKFVRDISDVQLKLYILNASLNVYPSLCEGFGMPILESLFLNSNTIFSETTAMSSFNFCPNHFIDPYSIDDISRKMIQFLNSPSIDDFRNIISDNYNWDLSTQKLTNCLNKVYEKIN